MKTSAPLSPKNIQESLLALNKKRCTLLITIFFLAVPFFLSGAERWYISNSAGMVLEAAFSRLAIRSTYALSIRDAEPEEVPSELFTYLELTDSSEIHTLYEEGAVKYQRWVFRDRKGVMRVNTSLDGGTLLFLELYDENSLLIEERERNKDGDTAIMYYTYSSGLLIKGEAHLIPAGIGVSGATPVPQWTDQYRYTRSHSLREVQRQYHTRGSGAQSAVKMAFPRTLRGGIPPESVNSGFSYDSEFFLDLFGFAPDRIRYVLDRRGRVITEIRLDEEGEEIAKLENEWSDDRLVSVLYTAGEEKRLLELEYDSDGNRILERNYRQGILERIVRRQGDTDVEELYMDGELVLRAVWKDERKISEEIIHTAVEGTN